jgi:hypothetical protein
MSKQYRLRCFRQSKLRGLCVALRDELKKGANWRGLPSSFSVFRGDSYNTVRSSCLDLPNSISYVCGS